MEREVTEAMAKLDALGQGDQAHQILNTTVEQARARYDEINADTTINEDYRQQLLAQTWQKHADDVTATLTRMVDQAQAADTDDAATAFGIKGLPGDAAHLSMSRRDATDRVKGIFNSHQLMAELATADRQGDEILARAVAEQALAMRDARTLNAFTASRPGLAPAVERLWNATARVTERAAGKSHRSNFVTGGLIASLKPAGFERAHEYDIARRANAEK